MFTGSWVALIAQVGARAAHVERTCGSYDIFALVEVGGVCFAAIGFGRTGDVAAMVQAYTAFCASVLGTVFVANEGWSFVGNAAVCHAHEAFIAFSAETALVHASAGDAHLVGITAVFRGFAPAAWCYAHAQSRVA